ncbi:hypothetical protein L249_2871, partial [Ophiocordyceps polyrhachis-furcata BCC 54312]
PLLFPNQVKSITTKPASYLYSPRSLTHSLPPSLPHRKPPKATMTPEINLLLSRMTSSLPIPPPDSDADTTPKIILHSAPDAVALLVNALLQAQGFTLNRVGDQDAPPGTLPPSWSASQAFFYSHPSLSDFGFTVRVDSLGPMLDLRLLAEAGGGKTDEKSKPSILRLEWEMDDLVRKDGLPVRLENRQHVSSKLQRVFVSDEAVARFERAFQTTIIKELLPQSHHQPPSSTLKEPRQSQHNNNNNNNNNKEADNVVPTAFPRPPTSTTTDEFQPPGFDDELDLNRNIVLPDGRSPFSIGHDDLYPAGLGPRDPLRPCFGPPSAGMHPTFDDPLFGPNPGPDAFDPQLPPGARWDPVGPGPGPRFPPRGNNPFFGPGGGRNSFGGGGGGGII